MYLKTLLLLLSTPEAEGAMLKTFPIPVLVIISKYDVMMSKVDAEARKLLLRGELFEFCLCCGSVIGVAFS